MRLVTIFERYDKVHKNKDVGQVHEMLCSENNWTGEIWSETGAGNVRLKKIRLFSLNLHVLLLLLLRSKKIDVLVLYHLRYYTAVYSAVFKLVNRSGVVYVKGDFDLAECKRRGIIYSGFFLFDWITRLLKNNIDIVSSEHKELTQEIGHLGFSSLYVPNSPSSDFISVSNCYLASNSSSVDTSDRKLRQIIFVGRIGTYQKNVELFMDAIKDLSIDVDYRVVVMGPLEPKFRSDIDSGKISVPKNLIFTGGLDKLEDIVANYCASDALVMTSRFEGFPLCSVEGMYSGCTLIANHTSGVSDLIEHGKNGYFFSCKKELTGVISQLLTMPRIQLDTLKKNAHITAKQNLWKLSVPRITAEIEKLRDAEK